MKGNPKIIETLNGLLAEELTAINQYVVHAQMCANWKFGRLHKADGKRAADEMEHARELIDRILFLDGTPIVSTLNRIFIGADIETQHKNDIAAELSAIASYNNGIRLAAELGDTGSRMLLEHILSEEEQHIDWLEAQTDQIRQMGINCYLAEQVD